MLCDAGARVPSILPQPDGSIQYVTSRSPSMVKLPIVPTKVPLLIKCPEYAVDIVPDPPVVAVDVGHRAQAIPQGVP